MQHAPPKQGVTPETIDWLRALPFSGPDEDVSVALDAIEWLAHLDLNEINTEVQEALDDFAEIHDQARQLEALGADQDAVAFVCRLVLMALVVAHNAADRDGSAPDEPAMSYDEFRQRHIAPIYADGRRVIRTMRRRYRVAHGRIRGARGCAHRRARRAAARAAGVRSGSDPGDPEPASSRQAVVA